MTANSFEEMSVTAGLSEQVGLEEFHLNSPFVSNGLPRVSWNESL